MSPPLVRYSIMINCWSLNQPKRFVQYLKSTMHLCRRGRILRKECIINELPWFRVMTGYSITARPVELWISMADPSPMSVAKWPICHETISAEATNQWWRSIAWLGSWFHVWSPEHVKRSCRLSKSWNIRGSFERLTGTDRNYQKCQSRAIVGHLKHCRGPLAEFWKANLEF
jgi:hypothetical protein